MYKTPLFYLLLILFGIIGFFSKQPFHPAAQDDLTNSSKVKQFRSNQTPSKPYAPQVQPYTLELLDDFLETRETHTDHKGTIHWNREIRPFKVSQESKLFQWTSEDAMTPENMVILANNGENLEYFEEENQWTKRRQVVYVNEEFSKIGQKAFDGEVQEIRVPGFDGEEHLIKIVDAAANDAGPDAGPITGSIYGQIEGQPESKVYITSYEDYWAVTIENGDSYLQILNREHREFILSDIDNAAFAQINGDAECGLHSGDNLTGLPTEP